MLGDDGGEPIRKEGEDNEGEESSDFLPADFNLEHNLAEAKGPYDLLTNKQRSEVNQGR